MKDPSNDIRDWIYDILYGTIFYNGLVIPVYSFPPKDNAMPCIVLGEQTMVEDSSMKDEIISEHYIDVEIWDSYTGNDGSYKKVNSISSDIVEAVTIETGFTGSGGESVPGISGYTIVRLAVQGMATQRYLVETNVIIYKSITIRLSLEEN